MEYEVIVLVMFALLLFGVMYLSTYRLNESSMILNISNPYTGKSDNDGQIQYYILTLQNGQKATVSCDIYSMGEIYNYSKSVFGYNFGSTIEGC